MIDKPVKFGIKLWVLADTITGYTSIFVVYLGKKELRLLIFQKVYHMLLSMKSDNVEFVWYCGGHFDNGDSWKFFQCQESIQGIIIYPHIKFDDIGQYLIFAAIFKMATARNFSLSGIYSGHHSLPTYEMSLKSDNVRDSKSKLFLEYLFKI